MWSKTGLRGVPHPCQKPPIEFLFWSALCSWTGKIPRTSQQPSSSHLQKTFSQSGPGVSLIRCAVQNHRIPWPDGAFLHCLWVFAEQIPQTATSKHSNSGLELSALSRTLEALHLSRKQVADWDFCGYPMAWAGVFVGILIQMDVLTGKIPDTCDILKTTHTSKSGTVLTGSKRTPVKCNASQSPLSE